MEKSTMPTLFKRITFYLIGICAIGFGVAAIINAQQGAGAFDAFIVGVASKTGLTIGVSMNIVAVTFLLVAAVIEKKIPRFLSLITSVLVGIIIDFCMLVIFKDISINNQFWQWVLLISSTVVLSAGISFAISSTMPLSPADVPVIIMNQKFGIKLVTSKLIFDGIMLILAILLGGPVGIGTIIVTLGTGPLIQILTPYTKQWMDNN
ncbi:hypothetical protein H7E67_02545 [Clostridium gasigenes]|uniref:YczE/YyaS/YitT family protein n=2 Tax=Clostridium gasigenes TaxID=94869 RepID=UPI001624FC91|nr:hypothetical protein [Clostridium gasigenes]MBB6622300.1 hypothetical protein [Clostridium gasigenes]MBU3087080.1 hypothetical protein [Clostridium gasigenes]MBU3109554.1 hypothetical protein [Clostridium gasigenes]MBU3131102.1 hypothetical protein [Clostridium gasigenes]